MNLQPTLVGGRSNHTPLTDDGLAAASALGRVLGAASQPDVVVHTSAVRSQQTAQAIVAGAGWQVPMVLDDGLLEMTQGVAEGQLRERWWTGAALDELTADPLRYRLAEGAETHYEVQTRMRDTVTRLAGEYPGGRVLAVGHGIAIRTLVWFIRGGDHDAFRAHDLPNLGRIDLEVTASGHMEII